MFFGLRKSSPMASRDVRRFHDAGSAVERVREIYDTNTAYIRDCFMRFARGERVPDKVEACYPYVAITTNEPARVDTRLSYGFVLGAGRYSTTLTCPDIFSRYYREQFELLMRNHSVPLEVGVSACPIPVHFTFHNGDHVEGNLRPEQVSRMRQIFSLPDLSVMDDTIANGTHVYKTGRDLPLSLFTAPRVDYSLQRLRHYTGTDPADFQNFVIFTNYNFYVDEFVRLGAALINKDGVACAQGSCGDYTFLTGPNGMRIECDKTLVFNDHDARSGSLPQMPAYHLARKDGNGITLINIGVGPSNARNISDHVAVLRPSAWLMLGHCAGLRETQKLGDYVLAHGYVRDDHALNYELPLWVPIPALAEVQRALESAVSKVTALKGYDLKSVMRTGTVVSTDNRNWEVAGYNYLVERFSKSRAIALDMESAVIAANGFRFRVPYGTLLCVSDRPLHGEIKLPGMANDFYRKQVDQHLQIGLKAMEILREQGLETLHSRKLRSFAETAFQ